MKLWTFYAPPFGTLTVEAASKDEARVVASRFKGWRDLRAARPYRRCERCDSAPCACGR